MKKYSIALIIAFILGGCDDFLDRKQLSQANDDTYWVNENNLRLFANGFYPNYFVGYNTGFAVEYAPLRGYTFSDDLASTGKQSSFETQAPAARGSTGEGVSWLTSYAGPSWNFAWVRKSNLFLERIEKMHGTYIEDEPHSHWTAVGRFFRGYEYSRLVSVFGNVPYFGRVLSDAPEDVAEAYRDRDDRTFVMDKVYDDFVYALANMRLSDSNNPQNLNRYIAAGFISRLMLFEGTFQKYHLGNTAKAQQYLQLAVQAADIVIQSGKWNFTKDYRSLFGSESLSTNTEMLMYRTYDAALTITHSIASYSNLTESQAPAANLDLIKSFIVRDGQPYQNSGVANASQFDIANLIVTRDPRFEATFWSLPRVQSSTLIYADKFIDRVGPTYAGAAYPAQYGSNTNTNDAPVMRYAEVVLNWLEAKAELETMGGAAVTQADLDVSINAIRNRPIDAAAASKGVLKTAAMQLAALPNDPDRDPSVPVLLWEIRRERRMEFAFEHTRLLDLKRWKKLEYMDAALNPDILLGPWVSIQAEMGNSFFTGKTGTLKVQKADGTVVTFNGSNQALMIGYYMPTNVANRDAFTDRVYLAPVGNNEISQYLDKGYTLTQTPGW
jgi:starch-binding outer membrane protein, SusD/RagB family